MARLPVHQVGVFAQSMVFWSAVARFGRVPRLMLPSVADVPSPFISNGFRVVFIVSILVPMAVGIMS